MGSVKDLVILEEPTATKPGNGRFIFSDRYSVFDWGEMPNHILNKGYALCGIGAYFFEKLEEMGIKTHYVGTVEKDTPTSFSEVTQPVKCMEVKLLRVIKPQPKNRAYDYSAYQKETANFLIPLEIIYRNSLPEGSSVFRRIEKGDLKIQDIGLDKMPLPGQQLEKPILDVSTKLEASDRYIGWEEAKTIAALTADELEEIKRITRQVNELITRESQRLGLVHEDGKIEFGFDENRNLMLVDVLGTPDECRFTFNGIPVSKELARIFYRKTSWYEKIEKAKKENSVMWKNLVDINPPPLPQKLSELISLIYQSFSNELTGNPLFASPPLKEILREVAEIISK